MIKEFFLKKMIQSQLSSLPKEEREKVSRAIESNPEFFMKLADEFGAAMKSGKDQMSAAMELSQKYKEEIRKLM